MANEQMQNPNQIFIVPDGKVRDYIDGKIRNETPEEYVRQTIEKRLVNEHKYSPKQIKIEYTLQLGSRKPRADIVIFDKPPFMPVHPSLKHYEDTLANYFTAIYPDCVFRSINRLDRNTSGIVIVAKNKLAADRLARLRIFDGGEHTHAAQNPKEIK